MKKKIKNNKKIIILIGVVLLVVILIILIAVSSISNKTEESNNISTSMSKSEEEIKRIIEKYDGTYIEMQSSTEEGFVADIYLYFAVDLFDEDGKSQEFYYTSLVDSIAKNEKINLRLIDKSRDITIRVYYNKDSNFYNYTVNGVNDYFTKFKSKKSLDEYKEISLTEVSIDSEELKKVIDSNWKVNNEVFGTKDSIYEDYDIFFEEGIKVKRITDKVFNIVFNKKYDNYVMNNIKVGDSFSKVEEILGKATFKNDDVIGYKCDNLYVFFEEDEISVYNYNKYEYEEFENILRKYINSELTVKEFTNELTYLWNDYLDYSYSSQFVYLRYDQQGVIMSLSPDKLNNITILGNYGNLKGIQDLINDNKINADLQSDGMFIYEQKRFLGKNSFVDYTSLPDYVGSSSRYMAFVKNNKVEFKAIDETKDISYRLVETINSYFWFSDTIFVYSVSNKGIYYFNLDSKEKTVICEGNEQFTFESFEDGKLMYDGDKSVELESD